MTQEELAALFKKCNGVLNLQPVPHKYFFPQEKHVPSFTAKHYIAVADVVHSARKKLTAPIGLGPNEKPWDSAMQAQHDKDQALKLEQTNELTLAFCKLFREDNPKFKEFQFIAACNKDLDDGQAR